MAAKLTGNDLGPPWTTANFGAWAGVVDQAPMLSSTNSFRLEHQLTARRPQLAGLVRTGRLGGLVTSTVPHLASLSP